MITTFFRSSSYAADEMCNMNYYSEYILGWKGPSNIKADKGTICHKVLELLAIAKKAEQDGKDSFTDDIVGTLSVLFNLEEVVNKVYNYYSKCFSHHNWTEDDRYDCHKWVDKAILWNGGMFDPRRRIIVQPEMHFEIEIDKPWAAYTFPLYNGDVLSGQLGLKGTVDLITKIDDDTYEIVDWKTGRRLNWGTGEEKTQEKLEADPQLRLYHYAASKTFPNVSQIIVSIFFINDGGPFTICYDESEIEKTEEMIRQKFEKIKALKAPIINQSWKCRKFCHQGLTTFADTGIKPIQEFRPGQVVPKGQLMTKCEQLRFEVARKGLDRVTQEYTKPGHDVGGYKAPGEV